MDLYSSDIISPTVFVGPFGNLFFIDEKYFLFYYVSIKKKQTKTTEASLWDTTIELFETDDEIDDEMQEGEDEYECVQGEIRNYSEK